MQGRSTRYDYDLYGMAWPREYGLSCYVWGILQTMGDVVVQAIVYSSCSAMIVSMSTLSGVRF